MRRIATIALSTVLATACVGGSKEVNETDKARLAAFVLDKEPAIAHKREINFEDKIRLLGYKTEPKGAVRPGQKVKVTLYWKVDKALGEEGWNLFTHVLDGAGERILNIDNVGPLREWRETRQVMWPSSWKVGKVYVDEQEFTVPRTVKTNKIQIVTGLWKDAKRLKITKGPNAGENRALVAALPTTAAPAAPSKVVTRAPLIRVDKLEKDSKIKIDGKLDDDAWKSAPSTGAFVDVKTGRPNSSFPVKGSAKLLWDDEAFYIGFDIKDPDIIGGFKATDVDPHLWTKDTVEIMIDPDGDGDNRDYYEIQINPQNLVFDSQFDEYNKPRKEPNGPFGHQDWSAKLESAVTVTGTLDKPGDKDTGYVVEAKIPWKSFGKAKKTPPELGQTWRMNFYAMQNNSGVAWSPILNQGNFHKASRFGKVLWAEKGWKEPIPAPPSSASAVPAGSGQVPPPPVSGKKTIIPQPKLDPSKLPRLKLPSGGPKAK